MTLPIYLDFNATTPVAPEVAQAMRACHSDADGVSGVLAAMGCVAARARAAVRLSVGWMTTLEDIEVAATASADVATDLCLRQR
ncbi:MAG: hypothetical protein PHU46_02450 [Rhodocyclaceae bacterium]|nr:hypothetical protein [Rhodocyclaceae bacterium]